ncbi:MAG: 5-formyltetrahydrofolate cyclo-ligase, partial [Pyrinomonadaceae bacterium]|nr:5-formyltetrahydrofolate cyclo-ligase [Pyrinomonadaceae bacterium]
MKKKELRKEFLVKRKSLTNNDFRRFSLSITHQLLKLARTASSEVIHSYIAIEKNREYDPQAFLEELIGSRSGVQTAVPKVIEGNRELSHFLVDDNTEFETSEWGIVEPVNGKQIEESKIDLIVVPLLCFDIRGHRVGYGGGFYDRFLAKCRPDCLKVGVSFFGPIDEIEDVHEGDVRLDYCVTPKKTYCFI